MTTNRIGHIAFRESANLDVNGNPRHVVKILTVDGQLVDVIAYDCGNVDYILRSVGVPEFSATGTLTASEYREAEQWRTRQRASDPEVKFTEVRKLGNGPNGSGAIYRVRFPNGRTADPYIPRMDASSARPRYELLSHQ